MRFLFLTFLVLAWLTPLGCGNQNPPTSPAPVVIIGMATPTSTPIAALTPTMTFTPTYTPTQTFSPTLTLTPTTTATPIPVPGQDWFRATQFAAFDRRGGAVALEFQSFLWLIGGYNNGSGYLNDVWDSSDGMNWNPATASAAFSPREYHSAVVHDAGAGPRLWVIAGMDASRKYDDVWRSADGVYWELSAPPNPAARFSPRYGQAGVTWGGRMWVVGGLSDLGPERDIWSSADGAQWDLINNSAAFSGRFGHSVLAYNGKLWLIGGYDTQYKNDVWSSLDGRTWTMVRAAAPFTPRGFAVALVYQNAMWVIGGNVNEDVWSSTDGYNWTQVAKIGGFGKRTQQAGAVHAGKMWIIAGFTNGQGLRNDVWYSP